MAGLNNINSHHFPLIPILPISHLMASSSSKPLNPNADPFLSPPPPPPPYVGDSPIPAYGTLYYPRATPTTYFWQFRTYTYPTVSCYNAWPHLMWPPPPPCPAASVGFGGGTFPKHAFKRDFLVSSGPRREFKSPPFWVEKKINRRACGGDGGGDDDPVKKIGRCKMGIPGITTLMIKNIPNQFKRRDLLQFLDRYCQVMNQQRNSRPDFCASEYDFVYLPMDFRRSWDEGKVSNLGYAFVNFTTPMAASQFRNVYHNYKWDVNVNKKICEITHARIQGKEALTNAFKNKIFWCNMDQYLPLMLCPASNGQRRYRRVNVGRRISRYPRKPMKKISS